MSELTQPPRRNALAQISLALALCSFGASLFQSYLNSRNLEVMQRDVGRREHIHACKEAIEAFFESKMRIARLAEMVKPGVTPDDFEAAMAVSRFGAIGTYLANFQGDDARYQYTMLTRELQRLMGAVKAGGSTSDEGFFRKTDEIFAAMNADCVRSSQLSLR